MESTQRAPSLSLSSRVRVCARSWGVCGDMDGYASMSSFAQAHLAIFARSPNARTAHRLVQAEATLQARGKATAAPMGGTTVPQTMLLWAAACRCSTIFDAQREARLRSALAHWLAIPAIRPEHRHDQRSWSLLQAQQRELQLKAALVHLQPVAMQRAFTAWCRTCSIIERDISSTRTANDRSLRSAIEGKWALQRTIKLQGEERGRIICGVLRFWLHGHLARAWAIWMTAMNTATVGAVASAVPPKAALCKECILRRAAGMA
jgi:hypothetical protein